MRVCRTIALVLAIALGGTAAEQPLNVLFIGNSLTFTNDLPGAIAALAKDAGRRELIHASETPGGCTLRKHWEDGRALAKIRSRTWDWVVLQEMSSGPLKHPDDMTAFGSRFADEIAKAGAKTAWYMTWAYVDQPGTQPAITSAYTDLSAATCGTLVPVGDAWAAYRTAHPDEKFYNDNRHPSPAGTYLAACVFYSVIYGESPVGLPAHPATLDAAQARRIQETAWATVHDRAPQLPR